MPHDEIGYLPATEMAAAIRARRLSPVEIAEALFARIDALDPQLNAYCTLTRDSALTRARAAEAAVMSGAVLGPLHGVPMSIKDLVITRGVPTMRGSKIFADFVPDEDAPVVERLQAAGAIMLGKTTTPELGHKGMTDSLLNGITRNPWDTSRTPGGSSGGAAAAVAAGLGPLAVGTDAGGSIRIPASFSGIFGLKATFGRVPNYPPSAASAALLTHTGPMTRTVRDAALMLDVMAGPDPRDGYCLPADDTSYLQACEVGVAGLRVAWSPNLGYAPLDDEVERVAASAARVFGEELGCSLDAADPGFENPLDIFTTLWVSGLGSYLQPYLPKWREQISPSLLRMIEPLARTSAETYCGAALRRTQLWDVTRKFFDRYDLLLTPTMPTTAFPAGEDAPAEIAGQPIRDFGYTPFTFPFNLTGQPAASVPCGFSADGLPIGLQIVGRRFEDATVLRAAAAFEAARPWAQVRPPVG